MGKRLSKRDLAVEIDKERSMLDDALAKAGRDRMTETGVTPGGWSVKDILAHLISWQEMILSFHAAEARGEVPEVPGRGLTWRETPKLNELIYLDHRDTPLDEVLQKFGQSHRAMLRLMEETPDEDLVTVGRFRWAGPSWALSDFIRAETASHYRWASNHIRKWLKRNS